MQDVQNASNDTITETFNVLKYPETQSGMVVIADKLEGASRGLAAECGIAGPRGGMNCGLLHRSVIEPR